MVEPSFVIAVPSIKETTEKYMISVRKSSNSADPNDEELVRQKKVSVSLFPGVIGKSTA